jgi:hypothetical protein
MRFEWGSPRRLLALLGVILILFAIGSGHSSALNGWLVVAGVLLLLASLLWAVASAGGTDSSGRSHLAARLIASNTPVSQNRSSDRAPRTAAGAPCRRAMAPSRASWGAQRSLRLL